ncbi:TPA: hypothetical protein ACGFA2_004513 [Serratia marcescens]|uniref:hypothetical protein n=1 Tax=Serratia marcescens TaxID=615 RepID=UPI0036F9A5B9
MAETKRRLLQLNLDKVAAHSYFGKRFVDKHQKTEALASRQALLFNSISIGNMIIESGLDSAFKALDNASFANANKADRAEMILRALELFSGVKATSSKTSAPTPEPVEPKHAEGTPPAQQTNDIPPQRPEAPAADLDNADGAETSSMALPLKRDKTRTFS